MKKYSIQFLLTLLFLVIVFSGAVAQSDLFGVVHRDDLAGVEGVEVKCANCPQTSVFTDAEGQFMFSQLQPNTAYTFLPKKEGADAEGVTVLDLCQIRGHILGISAITDPHRIKAADANLNGAITTFDMALLSWVILEKSSSLGFHVSWIFNPTEISIGNLPANPLEFLGIKRGDVLREEEVSGTVNHPAFILPVLQANEPGPIQAAIKVKDFAKVEGFQLSLVWDPAIMTLEEVTSDAVQNFTVNNYYQPFPGRLNVLWLLADTFLTLADDTDILVLTFNVITPSANAPFGMDPDGIPFQILAEGCNLVDPPQVSNVRTALSPTLFQASGLVNPAFAGQGVSLQIESYQSLDMELTLTTISGQLIDQWKERLPAGPTGLEFQAPEVPGLYFLHLWAPDAGRQILKWVVIR